MFLCFPSSIWWLAFIDVAVIGDHAPRYWKRTIHICTRWKNKICCVQRGAEKLITILFMFKTLRMIRELSLFYNRLFEKLISLRYEYPSNYIIIKTSWFLWISLTICPYWPLPLVSPLNGIQFLPRDDECEFLHSLDKWN